MDILMSKALDNVMHREYYGLLAWNETQEDKPINLLNRKWLLENVVKKESYLLNVMNRVHNELSKEHAVLVALVLSDFWVSYATYFLGLYYDGNKEYTKAIHFFEMYMDKEEMNDAVQERYKQLSDHIKSKSTYIDEHLSLESG